MSDELDSGATGPQAHFLTKLLIIVFALGYITLAIYMIVDCWVMKQGTIKWLLGTPANEVLPTLFILAVYTILGSLLGVGTLDIVSFHKYVAIKRNFEASHVWGYFFSPWLAAILGLIVFTLLQSGLLVFAGGNTGNMSADNQSDVTNLGYLAVGFFSGFGWSQAIDKIRELISRFFTIESKRDNAPEALLHTTPAASDEHIQKSSDTNSQDQVSNAEKNDKATL